MVERLGEVIVRPGRWSAIPVEGLLQTPSDRLALAALQKGLDKVRQAEQAAYKKLEGDHDNGVLIAE